MEQKFLEPSKKIHLIGIGGIGMSGLARMYLAMGHQVQGSDAQKSEMTLELEKLGAKVWIGRDGHAVGDAGLVVYSSSIAQNHEEREAALKQGIRLIHRAEALAQICEGRYTIAVTGTHGKTTTTALVGMVLKEAGRDPSIVVGGIVSSFGGNACLGRGPEIVIEADESDSSFLKLNPDLEVITNIENDHLDHFKTVERAQDAYLQFVRRLPDAGEWFGCGEDPRVLRMAENSPRGCALYGFDPSKCSIYATDIVPISQGGRGMSFKVWRDQSCLGDIRLRIIGRHNVLNALAAVAVGLKLGISFGSIQKGLGKYEGAGRRFDVKFEDENFLVVDDYAHHPTEIKETLAAAKNLNKKRIVALFQPHRYTRTEALLEEFGRSFFGADKLIVTDIYAASETPRAGVTGDRLSKVVQNAGHPDAVFIERLKVADFLFGQIRPGDLVIALGAGDIYKVAGELSEFLRKNFFSGIRGQVKMNEPLSKHTSLRVGGPVDFWIEPEDDEDLKNVLRVCREKTLRVFVIGAGSNLLVPDEGLRAVAVHLASAYFQRIRVEKNLIIAGAGTPNALFIQYALEHGFGGCEFLSGIPGCIGGSVVMNAGSHQQSIDALIERVRLVGHDGTDRWIQKDQMVFGYRTSDLRDAVVAEVEFCLPRCDRQSAQKKLDEYRDHRMRTQDLQHASAGCMFKNPRDSGCSSGKLIEDAGLKGRTIGRAQVSEKHANFIINLGGAASADVLTLMREVQREVKNKFGVALEPEVKIL